MSFLAERQAEPPCAGDGIEAGGLARLMPRVPAPTRPTSRRPRTRPQTRMQREVTTAPGATSASAHREAQGWWAHQAKH